MVSAVFRPAVRRPALLGLVREVSRLKPEVAEQLAAEMAPLVDRATTYLEAEMDAGRLRRADPRLLAALCYATVTGIATEPEALRAVGWDASTVGLRRLRAELPAFLRAALAVGAVAIRGGRPRAHISRAVVPSAMRWPPGAHVAIAPRRVDQPVSTCARRRWA